MPEQVTRGDLPHWYRPGFAHFVTYRLAGSLPQATLRELRLERQQRLQASPAGGAERTIYRATVHKLMFAKYDRLLDEQCSTGWLADERVAAIVRENLYHHRSSKYELIAWCIMPNHVHVVLQPFESALTSLKTAKEADAGSIGHVERSPEPGFETPDRWSVLSRIMHSLKSYTANRANAVLRRTGAFWQKESYDHWIRDVDELERVVAYVAANPVEAGLCSRPHEWRFSSAYDRFCRDRSACAIVDWLRDDWRR